MIGGEVPECPEVAREVPDSPRLWGAVGGSHPAREEGTLSCSMVDVLNINGKLFIDGLKLNRQRFKDRTKRLAEIQILAKAGKITKEQAKEATSQLREIERNMNHTFWDVMPKA